MVTLQNLLTNVIFFDGKLISTDSEKILNEAKKFDLKTFKRPVSTSKDYSSDHDVIIEVLKGKKIKEQKYNFIVYLQPIFPIRKISQLTDALNEVIKKILDCSWSISKIDKKFHPKKVLKLSNKNLLTIYSDDEKKLLLNNSLEMFL